VENSSKDFAETLCFPSTMSSKEVAPQYISGPYHKRKDPKESWVNKTKGHCSRTQVLTGRSHSPFSQPPTLQHSIAGVTSRKKRQKESFEEDVEKNIPRRYVRF